MKYSTPELVVLGSAVTLVLGGLQGIDDNTNGDVEQPLADVVLGLDD